MLFIRSELAARSVTLAKWFTPTVSRLGNLEGATPVGVTCRTCDQRDCEQRVFPHLSQRMRFDENVRGRAFYAGHLNGDD